MAGEIERFWDERAREHAPYFVDNLVDYRDADMGDFWARGREAVARITSRLGVAFAPGDEVVEIGCGIGRLTRPIAERVARVWAFDVSSEMLRQAREHLADVDNVEWVHGDGTTLAPLADSAASACFSFVVFQHLPDPELTLGYVREMGRVLRPGGWSAFQVSNDPSVHRRRGRLREGLARLQPGRPRGRTHSAWLGSAVDLSELERVAAEAGLDLERVAGAGTQFCLVLLRKRR